MADIRDLKTGHVRYRIEKDTLSGADLSGINLGRVDLRGADLSGTKLSGAKLGYANLSGANLSKAYLNDANLYHANLSGATLFATDLTQADLSEAYLNNATLSGTHLNYTNLSGAHMDNADLSGAYLSYASFTNCPTLRLAKGLEAAHHSYPSYLDAITLRACVNHLPDVFLRGVGYNQEEIETLRGMYAGGGIKYYSCFIAYRHDDHDFAKYLHDQLEAAGVTCWLDERDMQGGKYERPQIQTAIKAHDKLLLICSEEMVTHPRVIEEIIAALQAEREGAGRKLFPVRLDDYICGKEVLAVADAKLSKGEWSEDWVRSVQTYHIPDFEQWKDHDKFQEQFERLLRDLKNKPDA